MTFSTDLGQLLALCDNDLLRVAELLYDICDDDVPDLDWFIIGTARSLCAHVNYDAYALLEQIARRYADLAVIFADVVEACPVCFSDIEVCDCTR